VLACSGEDASVEIDVERDSPVTRWGTLSETVGIGTSPDTFTPLLEPGCPLPCETTATFGTAEEGQEEILIYVFRGPSDAIATATSLGGFAISGFSPATGEGPEIAVTFRARADGIFLAARDTAGGAIAIERVDER